MGTHRSRVTGGERRPWLDIVSYGRRGSRPPERFTAVQLEQIARTVRRTPEVMVKVSGGGRSAAAVVAHLKYIDRHGRLDIETDDGERLRGRGIEKQLLKDWNLDIEESQILPIGKATRADRGVKQVHNVVLSMPKGTNPDKLLKAARAFARERFAVRHRYALVLHTDQEHPHVHLVVKAMGEDGVRLNIKKATLREWREAFASALRAQGIAANATPARVRGGLLGHQRDGLYRTAQRGTSSYRDKQSRELSRADRPALERIKVARERIDLTEARVRSHWRETATALRAQGHGELARQVDQFAESMPRPRTRQEQSLRPARTR